MSEMTETTVTPQATKTWDAFNLRDDLLRGIYNYGFEAPSEIQQKAIVPFIAGGDILAQAQSGSGKTGTFSISILQRLDVTVPHTQAIVLSPTHELAKQTAHVLQQLGSFMEGLKVRTLIGGTPVNGTPGPAPGPGPGVCKSLAVVTNVCTSLVVVLQTFVARRS